MDGAVWDDPDVIAERDANDDDFYRDRTYFRKLSRREFCSRAKKDLIAHQDERKTDMKKNALSPVERAVIIRDALIVGQSPAEAAKAAGYSSYESAYKSLRARGIAIPAEKAAAKADVETLNTAFNTAAPAAAADKVDAPSLPKMSPPPVVERRLKPVTIAYDGQWYRYTRAPGGIRVAIEPLSKGMVTLTKSNIKDLIGELRELMTTMEGD